MLSVFRSKHTKKVIWILAGVIIFVFGLSGANFFLRGRDKTAGFSRYAKMARLYLILTTKEPRKITPRDIGSLGADFSVLLRKAKQDKISVSDEEVIDYIVKNFFPNGSFNKVVYDRFLQYLSRMYGLNLTSRNFEEYARNFIRVRKVFEKNVQVGVKDEEVKNLYEMENQKAKIEYLFIPFEKFKVDIGIAPKEIEEFYRENKNLFKREPKVKIKYITVEENSDLAIKVLKDLPKAKNIDGLENKFSLEAKETDFLNANDPIEEIGWQPRINKAAFELEKNEIGPPFIAGKNIVIIEKIDETSAVIPSLGEIESEVKDKFVEVHAKEETERYGRELLERIKEEPVNLKKTASKEGLERKETDYFKRYDYIEGLGLDRKVSGAVFALEKGQIHPEPLTLANGVYIIRLEDMTSFDEEDFQEKKQGYVEKIKQNKEFMERNKFLNELKEGAGAKKSRKN